MLVKCYVVEVILKVNQELLSFLIIIYYFYMDSMVRNCWWNTMCDNGVARSIQPKVITRILIFSFNIFNFAVLLFSVYSACPTLMTVFQKFKRLWISCYYSASMTDSIALFVFYFFNSSFLRWFFFLLTQQRVIVLNSYLWWIFFAIV